MNKTYEPIRDPLHKNYLSFDHYPMNEFPPFALGNFYIIDGRTAEYLAINSQRLKTVGTLEDVSISVWLMSLQV